MARMDVPTAVTKRRSIPRILSSCKKNTFLSPIDTNFKDEPEDTGGDSFQSLTPQKQEAECSEGDEKSTSPPLTITTKRDTSPVLPQTSTEGTTSPSSAEGKTEIETDEPEDIDECQEIRVNPMITVRRGPQVHIPSRVRCQLTTTAVAPENSDSSKLTPNEMLIALVNFFAPPPEAEEAPPLLERETTSLDNSYISAGEESPPEDSMDYVPQSSMDSVTHAQQLPMTASTSTFKQTSSMLERNGVQMQHLSQLSGTAGNQPLSAGHHQVASTGNNVVVKSESKYPPMTLGGVIGIRRPRTTSQNYNNNLTLDQLNPTLAEALAAMKSKSDVTQKSSGTSNIGSDGFSNRRDSLPTRMSGPVKLEALTPTNSTSSQCANTMTSGHLVSFNGQTTEVPEEIRCHLCDYPMKLCIRKSKYKGEIREYAAYRCLRKGCQTFRSVRKVIEPDFPCPRKRKADEGFDSGNMSPQGAARSDVSGHATFVSTNGSNKAEGTLLYIPGRVTQEQVEQMQKFAMGFLGKNGGAVVENVSKPLFAYVNMTARDIDEHLRTDDGQKKLQRILMHAPQPPSASFGVVQQNMVLPPPFNPFAAVSQLAQSVFNPANSLSHMLAPVPPVSVGYGRTGALPSGMFGSIQCAVTRPENVLPTMQSASHSICGMAIQTRVPDFRSHQYASEMIW